MGFEFQEFLLFSSQELEAHLGKIHGGPGRHGTQFRKYWIKVLGKLNEFLEKLLNNLSVGTSRKILESLENNVQIMFLGNL